MDNTEISWTDATWNVLRGCSRVSEGCRNCYAERMAARFSGPGMPYEGLAVMRQRAVTGFHPTGVVSEPRWTGAVRFVRDKLEQPLRWRRPRRIFVNSMSDLFHEKVGDSVIWQIFNVMRRAHWHTFQVLTKRPERMVSWFSEIRETIFQGKIEWPLPNVWLGVSAEDQKTWDMRTELLRKVPAAVRFVSLEPQLAEVVAAPGTLASLDWVIIGGESGPYARPYHVDWARGMVQACLKANVAPFVKQLGANPLYELGHGDGMEPLGLKNKKGSDMAEWPADLRVQQFPRQAVPA